MKILDDYRCIACSRIDEHYVERGTETVPCIGCLEPAKRVMSARTFILPGTDPSGFPTAADRWVKRREAKMREERKRGMD